MKSKSLGKATYVAVFILYLLHNDVWFWQSPRLVLGLPIGLLYHVLFCFASAGIMVLLVKFAWPNEFDNHDGDVKKR